MTCRKRIIGHRIAKRNESQNNAPWRIYRFTIIVLNPHRENIEPGIVGTQVLGYTMGRGFEGQLFRLMQHVFTKAMKTILNHGREGVVLKLYSLLPSISLVCAQLSRIVAACCS